MATLVTQQSNDLRTAENQIDAATNITQLKSALNNLVKATRNIKKRQDRIISIIKELNR